MRKIGVTELSRNPGKWLRFVKQGESFEVTERGHAVALLVPVPPRQCIRERLVASGAMIPGKGNLLDLGPPLPPKPGEPLPSAVLTELRAD